MKLFPHRRQFKRLVTYFVLVSCTIIIFLHIFVTSSSSSPYCWSDDQRNCATGEFPKTYNLSPASPTSGDSIFFIESQGTNFIPPRMICAIESAARLHPHLNIRVFMTTRIIYETPAMGKVLRTFSNVFVLYLDVNHIFEQSPLRSWFKKRLWTKSSWPVSHLSDVLRWVVLWKYGGIYLDLDVIVVKRFLFNKNFTGLESDKWVGAGVLGFTKHHPLIEECLDRIRNPFDTSEWGSVGPILLTKVLQDRCGLELPSGKSPGCSDIDIFPSNSFYKIPWWEWKRFVTEEHHESSHIFSDENIFAVHVWNTYTKSIPIDLNKKSLYSIVARQYCPILTQEMNTIF